MKGRKPGSFFFFKLYFNFYSLKSFIYWFINSEGPNFSTIIFVYIKFKIFDRCHIQMVKVLGMKWILLEVLLRFILYIELLRKNYFLKINLNKKKLEIFNSLKKNIYFQRTKVVISDEGLLSKLLKQKITTPTAPAFTQGPSEKMQFLFRKSNNNSLLDTDGVTSLLIHYRRSESEFCENSW